MDHTPIPSSSSPSRGTLHTSEQELHALKTATIKLPDIHVSDRYKGLKVLGLVADSSACGYYRVINPLHMLRMHGAQVTYSTFHTADAFYAHDVIVVPRQHNPDVLEILKTASFERKLLVYEIDDDLDSVDPTSPAFAVYHNGSPELRMIPEFLYTCHGMTTTTPELARWYYKNQQNVAIIENHIDYSFRNWGAEVRWDNGQPQILLQDIQKPAQREGKINILWAGGSCYDDQTEVLTDQGWKLFKDLDKTEQFATLNKATHKLEYQSATEYMVKPYKGKLMCADTPQINYAVTPNHWMYTSPCENRSIKKRDFTSEQMGNLQGTNFWCKKDAEWEGEEQTYFEIPSYKNCPSIPVPMDEWLKFFGFWLAEGYTGSKLKQVGITQVKDNGLLAEMWNLLESWGFTVNWSKEDVELRICSAQLWEYLHQFKDAVNKFMPDWCLQLSKRQQTILLDYFIKGDGHIEENGRQRAWTSSRKLSDQLVEMALKIGWAANVITRQPRSGSKIRGREITATGPSYQVCFLRDSLRNFLQPLVLAENQFEHDYDGTVYCVTVPNHVLYVRREGKVMWCGNTHQLDLDEIGPAVRQILRKYPHANFCFYGSPQMGQDFMRKFSLPENQVEFIPPRHFLDYPGGLHGFDIALAPIACSQFNLCKSNLRCLEMCAVGCATIASNVGPYTRFSKRHPNMISLVGKGQGNFQTWASAMEYLIENPDELARRQVEGRQLIADQYSLEKNFHQWPAAWLKIKQQLEAGKIGPPPIQHPRAWYKSYGRIGRNDPCPCGSQVREKLCCNGAWG